MSTFPSNLKLIIDTKHTNIYISIKHEYIHGYDTDTANNLKKII